MKKWLVGLLASPIFFLISQGYAQTVPVFRSDERIKLRLQFSRDSLQEFTNDSTYMPTGLVLISGKTEYKMPASIRARGNFRKKNCFYIPLKFKFEPARTIGTPIEGISKFKLVLPCKIEPDNDDALVKEFLAYQIYEQLMPFHFKTKPVDIVWIETSGKRHKEFPVKGFILEDIDEMARRYGVREIERNLPPRQQDDSTSVGMAYFQFLIANTDFSTRLRHNIKLVFKDGSIIPIPFDFDLSGLVNASYADVSGAQHLSKRIDHVTQRAYKGYLRDKEIMEAMRSHFLERKSAVYSTIAVHAELLENRRAAQSIENFVAGFYKVFEDDKRFERLILRNARE